ELGSAGLSYRMGHRQPGHLIEQLTRIASAEAGRRMRLGALVRPRATLDGSPLPPLYSHVATALTLGQIGADAATMITQHLQQAAARCAPDDLFEAERCLVDQAREDSADLVGIQARLWRDTLDADGAEPRDEGLRMRREVRLGRERGGMTPLHGQLDPVGAARFRAMIDSYSAPGCSPRFRDESDDDAVDDDAVDGDAQGDDSLPETRTPGQRNCDILLGVITAGMAADPTAPKSKTTIVLTMRADDYLSGTGIAWLSGVQEPSSATHAQELSCDAELRLMRLGDHGEVLSLGLSLGRTRRLFSSDQRLALTVRDGGCVWPHCGAPPAWCDAHHAIPWSSGGPTDVSNGVLLCPAHHHMLHHSDFTLVMRHGIPHLTAPLRLNPSGREWRVGRSRITTVLKR
ncbi:MAG: endonuclease, partial [Microbacteriaceae bacterium]|nr:endonuclease [Microbacteriaceae bacterium]